MADIANLRTSAETGLSTLFETARKGFGSETAISREEAFRFFEAAQPIAAAAVSGDIDVGITALTGGFFSLAGRGTLKVIGGGLPVGAYGGRAEVMDSVHPGGLGGTYGGNPVATAAALAVFEAVEEDGLLEKARRIEQVIREHFEQNADDRIAEVRGRGVGLVPEDEFGGTGVRRIFTAEKSRRLEAMENEGGPAYEDDI